MFEGAVAGVLNRLLGKYVEDLDTESLNVGIFSGTVHLAGLRLKPEALLLETGGKSPERDVHCWTRPGRFAIPDTESLNVGIFSGTVHLTGLRLKPEALYELDLPIDVKIGTIGHINIQIPWTSLSSQPVIVNIEDVLILVGPAISNSHFDPEREKRLTRAAKRKILQDLEAESEILSAPKNIFESIYTAVLNNIQIYVRNVHVRYEDSISSSDGPMACGLCLQSLSIETTNSKWKPSLSSANASTIYQLMRLESLSFYWNPQATVLADAEIANITPMQYYNWKHYMVTGLDKFNMHQEDFEFLLKPVSAKVKLIVGRSEEVRAPRLLFDAVIQDSAVTVSRRQLVSARRLCDEFGRISLNRKYRHLHPGVPVKDKGVKLWWLYAYKAVVEQRVKPFSWKAIALHRRNYVKYRQIYKSVLRSPNDTELKLDLQQCEDNLPIMSVVLAREQAKFELLSQEPDRIQVVTLEEEWWRSGNSPELSDCEENVTKVKLCTAARGNKSLWSHLSTNEKDRLRELIGFLDTGPHEKPKHYIDHKINLTLSNSSVTLSNRNTEVFVLTLTQILLSLETRPTAKAYKVSLRAESIMVEGLNSSQELSPILTPERSQCTTASTMLSVDVERHPLHCQADYGVSLVMETVMVHYNEHALIELLNFFQTPTFTSESLTNDFCKVYKKTYKVARRLMQQSLDRRKLFNLNVDVKGICFVIPERESGSKASNLLIVDVHRTLLRTDLQPTELVLEDATCMELEERMYDRVHAETTCQILFCDKNAPWREARKHADSDLHLLPKMKTQVVFSNSVRKEYKLLPRHKLNVSVSSLKLNLSDRNIFELLDFMENFPTPAANTLAAGSPTFVMMDSFQEDLIQKDLGYKELVKLRQKIVDAYFKRNRAKDKPFNKECARASFLEKDAASLSDRSEEEVELFARSVDLPGFEDNVSPNNKINTLMRFVIGEIVINLSRSSRQCNRRYVCVRALAAVCDLALLDAGPACQFSVRAAYLTDHLHQGPDGQPLEIFSSDAQNSEGLFNLLYRKVRANCPDFRSHFHSVEQSLVADAGDICLLLNSDAMRTLYKYLQYIFDKIKSRHSAIINKVLVSKVKVIWERFIQSEKDTPVPTGATKFSYSIRISSIKSRVWQPELSSLLVLVSGVDTDLVYRAGDKLLWKLGLTMLKEKNIVRISSIKSRVWQPELSSLLVLVSGVDTDLVYRAGDKLLWKLGVTMLKVDDGGVGGDSLYPALVWPDEDKVLELKYVRSAPKLYGGSEDVKANGELKIYVGRVHVVLFCSVIQQFQLFFEPLLERSSSWEILSKVHVYVDNWFENLSSQNVRLHLAIVIHAPVFLLPQKQTSPNLLVLNLGDITIENFFKQQRLSQDTSSPIQNPIIDNILAQWSASTLSRAVMTLAGSLEVQEPILEPMSFRCDLKRTLRHSQVRSIHKDLLKYDISAHLDTVYINIGQRDLATIIAVWRGNISEGYLGGMSTSRSSDTLSDPNVLQLQEFLARGEPVRKDVVFRFALEGVSMKFYLDLDEVLSSPVRDSARALCGLQGGEFTMKLLRFTDKKIEIELALQSLAVEDIRIDSPCTIKRIFECSGHTQNSGTVRVSGAALLECQINITPLCHAGDVTQCGTRVTLTCDRARLNVAPAVLLPVLAALHYSLPGELSPISGGGEINHGFVGDVPPSAHTYTSTKYCTQFYQQPEDNPPLTISIQFRQPEIMFYNEISKTESHALLLRTELLIDYSSHSNTQSLCISLAGLQIMSKLQSKFKSFPIELVLKPCDVEYSKILTNVEEGWKVCLSFSEIDLHLGPSTIHTVLDIIEEIKTELTVPEEKDSFHFNQPPTKSDEDLWSPKKLAPSTVRAHDEGFPRVGDGVAESFCLMMPSVKVMFELEEGGRHPVVQAKLQLELNLNDWCGQAHGSGTLAGSAECYNESLRLWEPLWELVTQDDNTYTMWSMRIDVFMAKAYPISTKLDTSTHYMPPPQSEPKCTKRRSGFESETSDGDTDNETVFIKHPNAYQDKANRTENGLTLDGDDSDSENENRLMDKLTSAIRVLFTDDSSAEDNNQSDSSDADQSEIEIVDARDCDKAVSFVDSPSDSGRKEKNIVLEEGTRSSSPDSGVEAESAYSRSALYIVIHSTSPLRLSAPPCSAAAAAALCSALRRPRDVAASIVEERLPLELVNDIGPDSRVDLISRAAKDASGDDTVIASAEYIVDISRPSTPGCDTSSGDALDAHEDEKHHHFMEEDQWNCFEGGFTGKAVSPVELGDILTEPMTADKLYKSITSERLKIKIDGFDELMVLCPQRSANKLHVLRPSKNNLRYFVVVDVDYSCNSRRILVRSPLQVRNETSYPLELYYKLSEEQTASGTTLGSIRNPFDNKLRLCTLAPSDTCVIPLNVAYGCVLYLMPTGTEKNYSLSNGIWWGELSRDITLVRDLICPSKNDSDNSVFAMRMIVEEGQTPKKITRAIPNYLLRIIPPVCLHNRLPCPVAITISASLETLPDTSMPQADTSTLLPNISMHQPDTSMPQPDTLMPQLDTSMSLAVNSIATTYTVNLEPGAKVTLYESLLEKKISVELNYMKTMWSQWFSYNDEISEKWLTLNPETKGTEKLRIAVRISKEESRQIFLYAPYWVVNKTGLPVQIKVTRSDTIYSVTSEPMPFGNRTPTRIRVRAHGSRWSRAVRPQCTPGLIVCVHKERACAYRILINVVHSEQSPELTKIVTLLPYFLVYNDTKRHLRFMEENESADLWIDLSPQQIIPFWPQTSSMAMYCKFRESTLVSQHFAITKKHFTVLRMDKGSAISVEVNGGTETPFSITFKPYTLGDAPVKIHNLCEDIFLKLHQINSGQVALLGPNQSMLYTWDDPMKERVLLWNTYNNKGQGYVADFAQDGYGEQKVSLHSVKHTPLTSTNSVTSKLSSTFKRLTPKSPEAHSSSSEDSNSTQNSTKPKKTRKDKIIIYWVSFTDGLQRIFALAQNERIAYDYQQKVLAEKSNYEVYLSLANVGVSLCYQFDEQIKEISYLSFTDSLPRWEVSVSHKWKQLTPELTAWIEDKYQKDIKKCNLKDYLHIDLEKMQMTKPFYSELRRIYYPGLWVQYRMSDNYSYLRFKIHKIQIDNQINDALYPCVLHLTPSTIETPKPSVEVLCIKQTKAFSNQIIYKHLKVLIQEHNLNLERGFVSNLIEFLSPCKKEENSSAKLRKDLSIVHMPLNSIVQLNQGNVSKEVLFEFVHLSPLKVNLSLSGRDGSGIEDLLKSKSVKINGDFVCFLLDSWKTSVCEVKDLCFRSQYFELNNTYTSLQSLLQSATNHYRLQLLQQFYVLALNSSVLGNPYSGVGDFSKGIKDYYEPSLGILTSNVQDIAYKLSYGMSSLLGHYTSGAPRPGALFHDISLHLDRGKKHKFGITELTLNDIPQSVIDLSRSHPASLALALSGLIDRRNFDIYKQMLCPIVTAGLTASDAPLRPRIYHLPCAARARLPRHCLTHTGVSPYNFVFALGALVSARVSARGVYLAHVYIEQAHNLQVIIVTTEQIVIVRCGSAGACHTEWSVNLEDLIGVPVAKGSQLVLSMRQDELTSYFSTDEKCIEIPDPSLLEWFQSQIECALMLTMEDKRCPPVF